MMCYIEFQKQAAIKTTLQPHQAKAVQRALAGDLLLAHSLGSGKTLTSIAAADAIGKPTTVFTPASLVENYKKELKKHKSKGPPVEVLSLPTAISRDYSVPEGNTVILDEVHTLRNLGTEKRNYIIKQLAKAGRVLALTGTPIYNKPEDLAALVNLIARKDVLPADHKAFSENWLKDVEVKPAWHNRLLYGAKSGIVTRLKNKEKLKEILSPYIDVYTAQQDVPERVNEDVYVQMSPEQQDMYKYVLRDLPVGIRYKLKHNLPPSKTEARLMNAFLQDTRQIANTTEMFQQGANTGSKLLMAVQKLQAQRKTDPKFKALVYSNYLGSGIDAYAKLLAAAGIPYNRFTGDMTRQQKKQVVDDYNKGKTPIILGSGSASEGLDLKGTKLIQILEPFFNNNRIEQVIGRGIRYKSHEALPENERKVLVQRFYSTLPAYRTLFGQRRDTSVDEYLKTRSEEKDQLFEDIKDAIS